MVENEHKHIPVNNGLTCHICTGPLAANCPMESSRKNRGIPANTIIIRYGIMKAPKINESNYFVDSLTG